MWPRTWWPADAQMDFMKSAPSTPKAVVTAESISNLSVDPVDFRKSSIPFQRQSADNRFSGNCNEETSATSIAESSTSTSTSKSAVKIDCMSPTKPLSAVYHPPFLSKIKEPQSFSVAVLSSLSTTSDWIKTEVRRRGSLSKDHQKELNHALKCVRESNDKKEDIADNDNEDDNQNNVDDNENYENDDENNDNDDDDDDDAKLNWEEVISPVTGPNYVSCDTHNNFDKSLKIESSRFSSMKLKELVTSPTCSHPVSLCSSPLPAHLPTPTPLLDSSVIGIDFDPDAIVTPSPDHLGTSHILNNMSTQVSSNPLYQLNYSNSINIITQQQSSSTLLNHSNNSSNTNTEFNSLNKQDNSFQPTSPKPNEIEVRTIRACEAMNDLINVEQYDKQHHDINMANIGEEDVKVGNKWIEKLGEVSERLQSQFTESPPFFHKFASLSRSRSNSETASSISGITGAFTDFLTPISDKYRNHSFSFSGTQTFYFYLHIS